MKNARKRWGLGAALVLGGASLLAIMTPAVAASASPANGPAGCTPVLKHVNMNIPGTVAAIPKCRVGKPSDAAQGTPPLLFHGGNVMMTPQTGPLIITPIFWGPPGHPMALGYKDILLNYFYAVAAASGRPTNVFSVLPEYYGANGQIQYRMRTGFPIFDSNPLPASGCTVASTDTTGIYADGTGYNACLDDAQLQAEINTVTAANGLPRNLTHIYVLYLPKHVESCFIAGSTTTSANACTINYQPSAAYCAYHNIAVSNAIYAAMPYPIYYSNTGFTCGTEFNFGTIQAPNGNPDPDVEISPTSHEISEAITDPDVMTGWYDSSGFEIGDECAYVFGQVQGLPGHLWNQSINGLHFLTQEEFSNRDFAVTGEGCVQDVLQEA
jgi:hypothetical protein